MRIKADQKIKEEKLIKQEISQQLPTYMKKQAS